MEARKLSKSAAQPFQLSLRVRHPSMDPAELSREFGIRAEHSYRAGDPRPSPSGAAVTSVRSETYWIGALEPGKWPPNFAFPGHPRLQTASENMRAAATSSFTWTLSLSVSAFFNPHASLLRRIRSDGGQISLLVALSASEVGSFSLMPEVARSFGDLGIAVEFEFTDD